MKSVAMSKTSLAKTMFPSSPAEWEALISAAPGEDRPLTEQEEKAMQHAVFVPHGGPAAIRAALEKKRAQRGAQRAPTKVLLSVRYSQEVVSFFRATGTGWQARMDLALKDYVAQHQALPQ